MKKIIGLAAVLALVAGCGSEEQKPTGPKFATNLNAVTEYLVSGACENIGGGERGDYVLKCMPNSVFADAMAAQKTARVLSANIDIAAALADAEHVYVNVVADDACPMRVLHTGADVNDMYAAVVCPDGTAEQ